MVSHSDAGRVLLAFAVCLAVLSCHGDREARLYRAERDLWKARRVEQTLRIGPETPPTPEETEAVLRAYRSLLDRHPAVSMDTPSDSAWVAALERIRAEAQLGALRMVRLRDEEQDAAQLIAGAIAEHRMNPDLALRFHGERISLLLGAGDYDGAVEAYRDLSADLPARTASGAPRVSVQDAPIRAADLLNELGRQDEARLELQKAEAYYKAIIAENPNDQAAALAWVELGTIATRRGEFDRAIEALEHARSAPGVGTLQPRILYLLGVTHLEGRNDPENAAQTFGNLLAAYPDDPIVVETLIQEAYSLARLERTDDAIRALDRIGREHPRRVSEVALAEYAAARILVQAGRWPEALTRYRGLQTSHPNSPQAIIATFDIVAHFREVGEEAAVERTLERALERFRTIRDENAGRGIARMADEASVRALEELGRWEEAAELLLSFPASYAEDPRNLAAILDAARIYEQKLRNRPRAAEILEQLIATSTDSTVTTRLSEELSRLKGM